MDDRQDNIALHAVILSLAFLGLLFLFDVWIGLESTGGRIAGALAVAAAAIGALVLTVRIWPRLEATWTVAYGPVAGGGLMVVALAAAGLFFELSLIRWHGSLFPMFSFYKNFSLLACFAGLGLGYATARRANISLLLPLALLAFQIVLLIVVRYGTGETLTFLMTSPIAEQTTMGAGVLGDHGGDLVTVATFVVVYGLLASVFLTTIAMFVPVGRLTGRVMENLPRLPAYGFNLAGSIAGVLAFMAASELWLPPIVWFAAIGAVFLVVSSLDGRRRILAALAFAAMMVALAWPVEPTHHRIYSPYQVIETTAFPGTGLMQILAAGTYYQKVYDFSAGGTSRNDPNLADELAYYDLPYAIAPSLERVAVVGAGSGNDVAAALRAGAAEVDAVEIDPAIVALGRAYHPERPYADPRVHAIVEDARTFFRTTDQHFDVITYAVLDSHAQLSHGTSVRIDSFVYTQEAFAESFDRLSDGGVLFVSFAVLADAQAPRIFEMMRRAAGKAPIALQVGYDRASTSTFVLFKGEPPADWDAMLARDGFAVTTDLYTDFDPSLDIPTDDWPFF